MTKMVRKTRGWGVNFWASENWSGRVHFEGHSPEWRVLSKLSVQPCDSRDNKFVVGIKIKATVTLQVSSRKKIPHMQLLLSMKHPQTIYIIRKVMKCRIR